MSGPQDCKTIRLQDFKTFFKPDPLVYSYNVLDDRIRAVLYDSTNQVIKTTWYAGSYEKVTADTVTKQYYYINSPDGPVAVAIQTGTDTPVMYYICKDHLGSITGIMNSSGNLLEEYNYDPWGRRRNPRDWSYDSIPDVTYTQHGFTGHEHLDMFNLINMNGRIYDPEIARFLSPDPVIQDPYNILNYNRYSYCLNNPLKYIDPSGYVALKTWNDFWEVVDNLWNSGGGGWDSGSGNISYGAQGGGSSVPSGSGFQGPGLPYMLGEVSVTAKAPQKNTPTTATYDSNSLSPWLGWTNNGINAAAYGAYEAGGSIRLIKGGSLSFQYYASAWTGGSRARIITYNLSKIGTGVGVGTSITGAVMGGINFALSDKSWGDYGQLSISLLSAGLTLGGPTTPIGIGIGVMDLAGGFNGFYNYLDANQQFYNNTGLIMVPNNMGLPVYIKLRKP